jgi:hypothetical protein
MNYIAYLTLGKERITSEVSEFDSDEQAIDAFHEWVTNEGGLGAVEVFAQTEGQARLVMAWEVGRYWTLVVPYVAPQFATEWHPTEATGPLSTLTRGAFASLDEAIQWGRDHLKGTPYTVREVAPGET